jgi:hypothetical protein
MLKNTEGDRIAWADIEGKYVLLVGGFINVGFDGEFGALDDGSRLQWTIARVDDYSDMAEAIVSRHYYTYYTAKYENRNKTRGFETISPSKHAAPVHGAIHSIYPSRSIAMKVKKTLMPISDAAFEQIASAQQRHRRLLDQYSQPGS